MFFATTLSTKAFRLATLATCGAAMLVAAPAAEADRDHDRDHDRPTLEFRWGFPREHRPVVIERPVYVERPVVVATPVYTISDVVPTDLKISAFRSRGVVMVFIEGTNATAGYTTTLQVQDSRDGCTTLVMHNTSPATAVGACSTPFSINGSVHAPFGSSITVRIGASTLQAPIVEVPSL